MDLARKSGLCRAGWRAAACPLRAVAGPGGSALGGVPRWAGQQQMAAPGLQEPAKKALATLYREWDGLAAHREYPMVSLDNNAAERARRGPVDALLAAGRPSPSA
jgi:hypothetical protein